MKIVIDMSKYNRLPSLNISNNNSLTIKFYSQIQNFLKFNRIGHLSVSNFLFYSIQQELIRPAKTTTTQEYTALLLWWFSMNLKLWQKFLKMSCYLSSDRIYLTCELHNLNQNWKESNKEIKDSESKNLNTWPKRFRVRKSESCNKIILNQRIQIWRRGFWNLRWVSIHGFRFFFKKSSKAWIYGLGCSLIRRF